MKGSDEVIEALERRKKNKEKATQEEFDRIVDWWLSARKEEVQKVIDYFGVDYKL